MYRPHGIQWTPEHVTRIWDYYAQNRAYDSQYFAAHSGASIIQYVRHHLGLRQKRILDFGCGPGFLLEHLLKNVGSLMGSYRGVEFSRSSVEAMNAKFRFTPGFIEVIHTTSLPVAIASEQADIVFCIEVVEHLDDHQLGVTLEEIHRLLADDGKVVVTTPNCENLEARKTMCPECGCIFHRWQHVRAWTQESLTKQMESSAFRTVHVAATEFFPEGGWSLFRSLRRKLRKPSTPPHLIYIGAKG